MVYPYGHAMTTRILAQQIAPTGMTCIDFTHDGQPGTALGMAAEDTYVTITHAGRRWEADADGGLTRDWLAAHLAPVLR